MSIEKVRGYFKTKEIDERIQEFDVSDVSLKRFKTVFPACGSPNSAIELSLEELKEYSDFIKWIDVCKIL